MKNGERNRNILKRDIGLFTATILVFANMIGTGIFTTSGFIFAETGNSLSLLLCWFIGGVFALCGALCYGELGAAFSESGGEYVFLRESFGKAVAFLSGWISLVVGFSAPIAAAAIAFSKYGTNFLYLNAGPRRAASMFGIPFLDITPTSLLAILSIVVLSVVHCRSVALGGRVQNALTLFKICIIAVFIAGGFVFGKGSLSHFSADLPLASIFQSKFAVSLIFVSFAYSGWNAAAYLGSEIKNPSRNIPLALVAGTFGVLIIYLLLNTVYLYALSPGDMSGVLEIGIKSASFLFGRGLGIFLGAAIAFAILSTLSAMIMTGPRVYYAMSRDGVFLEAFGRVDAQNGTPVLSIILQAAIAVILILTASFEKLLLYIGLTLALFSMLTVVGLVVLRVKGRMPSRGYKTLGYPLTPVLFIAGNLWIILFSIQSQPSTLLWSLLTVGVGLFLYVGFSKKGRFRLRRRKKEFTS